MRVSKIWDGTDPGATPGRAFTADIGQEEIIQQGKFLQFLKLGWKGAITTGAVAVEAAAACFSEFVLRVGGQERIVLNLNELVALMSAYYNKPPLIGENSDNTGEVFIGGVKLPLGISTDPNKPITISAGFTTVSNVGTQTLAISGYWSEAAMVQKAIHAVRIALTSAAAAGYQELSSRIAPLGKLRYIIVKNTTGFGDGNVDVSIQRLRLKIDGQLHCQWNSLADFTPTVFGDNVLPLPTFTLGKDFLIFDCGEDGIDVKGQEGVIEFDVQDVSDAVVFIPVIEME